MSMKKGIIIVFSNNEKEIKETQFDKLLDKDVAEFCFVNNASNDHTLDKLKDIKTKTFNNISIVDVKKNKGTKAAIKAGVRYLVNNKELKLIIYLVFYKNTDFLNLEYTLNIMMNRNKKIINLNTNNRNILQNVFSLEQLIKKI
ncbi:glycosyltransferase, GT2 family [Formosa sp. Hel1_33_131]|nr:glycosyltransferase, GT2 family [Formosa sp. Hel1_33_131]